MITAGIYHVPTLQGNIPLTEEGPTGLMSEIEYHDGNVPLEGTPAAAVFSASAETSTPAQTNYTRTEKDDEGKGLKGGSPPKNFAGDRKDSERFLEEFTVYWKLNRKAPLMKEPYSRVLMAISYMKGEKNRNWNKKQVESLDERVDDFGWSPDDERLWKRFVEDFKKAYTNTTDKQDAYVAIQDLKMTGGDLDTYVADHEALVKRIGWPLDGAISIESFKDGLPDALLRKILNRDDPPEDYEEWLNAAQKEQTKWTVLKAAGLTGKGRDQNTRRQRWREALTKKPTQSNQNKRKDPDAMDVDNVRLNPLTDEERKRFMEEGRCFRCRQRGHMSKACPKKNEQNTQTKVNQTETKAKKRTTEIVDDRDEVSDAETEQTAVEVKTNKRINNTRIGKAKMTTDDVAKAIAALSLEERETVLDAVMMNEDF